MQVVAYIILLIKSPCYQEFEDPEEEIRALQREGEIPIDDLLDSLPLEMFAEHHTNEENEHDDDNEIIESVDEEK